MHQDVKTLNATLVPCTARCAALRSLHWRRTYTTNGCTDASLPLTRSVFKHLYSVGLNYMQRAKTSWSWGPLRKSGRSQGHLCWEAGRLVVDFLSSTVEGSKSKQAAFPPQRRFLCFGGCWLRRTLVAESRLEKMRKWLTFKLIFPLSLIHKHVHPQATHRLGG